MMECNNNLIPISEEEAYEITGGFSAEVLVTVIELVSIGAKGAWNLGQWLGTKVLPNGKPMYWN